MFVSQSKYDDAIRAARSWEILARKALLQRDNLLKDWNKLVDRINAKGGEAFLESDPKQSQFSQQEIDTLIRLCHPDKHNNSASSNEITKKLLSLRK